MEDGVHLQVSRSASRQIDVCILMSNGLSTHDFLFIRQE